MTYAVANVACPNYLYLINLKLYYYLKLILPHNGTSFVGVNHLNEYFGIFISVG